MPVLSRAHTDAEHFEDQTLQIPVGSGPYRGRRGQSRPAARRCERDPNYWARDLPINARALQFRRDPHRLLSATPRRCSKPSRPGSTISASRTIRPAGATATTFPPRATGALLAADRSLSACPKAFPASPSTRGGRSSPTPARAKALATMFDFEWINANLYAGVYKRSKSFFDDSELSAAGRPASAKERALLAPFPGAVRDDILEGRWAPPVSDGTGRDRALARKALDLLAAGRLRAARRRHWSTRAAAPLSFEILVKNRQEERLALAYSASLARIGVDGDGAPRRRSAVPAPPRALRFRHDDRLVDRLALAGQRAARPLELGRRRRWRAPTTSAAPLRRRSTR